MERARALLILQELADGVDPGTGAIFPEGSVCLRPSIASALRVAVETLSADPADPFHHARWPLRAGHAWTAAEDRALTNAFLGGLSVHEIALDLGRTIGAIRSRLTKRGLLDDDGGRQFELVEAVIPTQEVRMGSSREARLSGRVAIEQAERQAQSRRELAEVEARRAQRDKEVRKEHSSPTGQGIPEYEEGYPRPGWDTDEDHTKMWARYDGGPS